MADDNSPATTAVAVRPIRQFQTVEAPVGMMDTARFEHLGRVAKVLAMANLLPKSLTHTGKDLDTALPFDVVMSRAYLIAGQAELWNADPVAISQCTSLVHGKLCYEGKLIHGLVEARAGVRLRYEFGRYDVQKRDIVEDETLKVDDRVLGVRVSAQFPDENFARTISGSVEMWHTGDKGPWQKALNWPRQLRYRGAREWARAHQPHLVLGILTDDEVEDFNELALTRATQQSLRGKKADIRGQLAAPKEGGEGFSAGHIESETNQAPVIEGQVVETEGLKVGGEPAQSEANDAGAAGASEAEVAQTTEQGQPEAEAEATPTEDQAGSESADDGDDFPGDRKAEPEPEPEPKPKAERKKKAAPADPIEMAIETVRGMTSWLEQIKPAIIVLKKDPAWAEASDERKVDFNIAVVETVHEVEPDMGPADDVSFFSAWCTYMGATKQGMDAAGEVGKAMAGIEQNERYQALKPEQKESLMKIARTAIADMTSGEEA